MINFNEAIYKFIIRKLIFLVSAESAQRISHLALKQHKAWRIIRPITRIRHSKLSTTMCGLPIDNPIGLAAGLDKDCELIPSLESLGFGYLTVGTITENARTGNPKPRMIRLPAESALINALGFPNKGLNCARLRLEQSRKYLNGTPVITSISGITQEEILHCLKNLEPVSDAIEVNISSPNTAGLRVFQEPRVLKNLLKFINDERTKPLLIKMPPYPSSDQPSAENTKVQDQIMSLARVCHEESVDGLTLANSRPTSNSGLSMGIGGLSGKPLFSQMLKMVSAIRSEVGATVTINACGGISSGDDACEAIRAGATTAQLYTGIIYRGPTVIRNINKEILDILKREAANSILLRPKYVSIESLNPTSKKSSNSAGLRQNQT